MFFVWGLQLPIVAFCHFQVLVCAPSNAAVDEVLRRVDRDTRIHRDLMMS